MQFNGIKDARTTNIYFYDRNENGKKQTNSFQYKLNVMTTQFKRNNNNLIELNEIKMKMY